MQTCFQRITTPPINQKSTFPFPLLSQLWRRLIAINQEMRVWIFLKKINRFHPGLIFETVWVPSYAPIRIETKISILNVTLIINRLLIFFLFKWQPVEQDFTGPPSVKKSSKDYIQERKFNDLLDEKLKTKSEKNIEEEYVEQPLIITVLVILFISFALF